MHPEAPTQVYQDNNAAIQIELNRGSLGSHSRHISRKVLTSCEPKLCEDFEYGLPELVPVIYGASDGLQ